MSYLNPDHPVSQETEDQWHKFCALLMAKLNQKKVTITAEDMESFVKSKATSIVVHVHNDCIDLSLVDDMEALQLLAQAGNGKETTQ
jgi:hypothetical protein